MNKYERIKKNYDFDRIIKTGKCEKNSFFVIYYLDNNKKENRFGISVGKKIGNAVIRNYYKRIIRNICDKNKNLYSKGKDYIIILKKGSKDLTIDTMDKCFVNLMDKINS